MEILPNGGLRLQPRPDEAGMQPFTGWPMVSQTQSDLLIRNCQSFASSVGHLVPAGLYKLDNGPMD